MKEHHHHRFAALDVAHVRIARVIVFAAVWGAMLAAWAAFGEGKEAGDFGPSVVAARAMLHGQDPYRLPTPNGLPLFYPAPAFLFALPFSGLSDSWAGVVFFSFSSGLLAFALLKHKSPVLPVFLSAPYVLASNAIQWSPLLLASALLGGAWQGIFAAKPNIGFVLWLRRPNMTALLVGAGVVIVTAAVLPRWPLEWFYVARRSVYTLRFITLPGAAFLLIPIGFRWRNSMARVLAALLCVPHFPFFYDALPLWMVARTERDSRALTWCSWFAVAGWLTFSVERKPHDAVLHTAAPWVLWLVFAPAVILLLRSAPDSAYASGGSGVGYNRGRQTDTELTAGADR